eukprot:GHUV01013988.1.p2 GENE.GHUV01013988.1~~GHUV01013988.1.p2  ORF type:complete len:105 (+),score=12.16 GHUV01013988.1:1825-2139(+)
MGQGLIPADGEVWRTRRRALVPALHKKYIASMVNMFGDCALHGSNGKLADAARSGEPVEMENFFSRLALDIIGKVKQSSGTTTHLWYCAVWSVASVLTTFAVLK